jgi:lipid II:glycine glycyltransferase (peptidoglycan interpeptide bridge formation enzyme)
MKLLRNSEIDFERWDRCVLSSEFPLVFAQSFYLNATSPGWNALIEKDYACVMPLTQSSKLGITYLMQPPFTPQLGLYGKYSSNDLQESLQYIEQHYKFIAIELNASNKTDECRQKRTYMIRLNEDYEFNTNTKRNISKASKTGLKIEELKDNEILKQSKKHLNPFLRKQLKLPAKHIKLFEQLLVNSISEKKIGTFAVKNNSGEIRAIAHFISNGKHAVYLKGMNYDKNNGSMHFLIAHAIDHYKRAGVKLFDFGGGQSESLARFYAGFGAMSVNYCEYKINGLPKAIRWLKR